MRCAKPVLIGVISLLAACDRQPASQTQVDVKPGQYRISYGGGMMGFDMGSMMKSGAGGDLPSDTVCVKDPKDTEWVHGLFGGMGNSGSGSSCRTDNKLRQGNAISGVFVCPMADGTGGGDFRLTYTGTIAAEEVALTGKMQMPKLDGAQSIPAEQKEQVEAMSKMMEMVEIRVTAKREGDCKAS